MDFTNVTGIKTAFINGVIEVIKYIKASGGAVVIIPGSMNDILEITGIKQLTQTVTTIDEAKIYARLHFPHIIDYILSQKEKKEVTDMTASQSTDLKDWNFFIDTEKKNIDIEKVLKYAILSKASDTHLAVNKPITYRIEGVLIKIESEPILTSDHLAQIKTAILEKHPEIEERLDKMHDADFGYISKEDAISFRVNGAWSMENLTFTFRRIEQAAKSIQELGLPEAINTFLKAKQGLVLVT
jgi:type II secretory ATPase GspE/PulE/Tfp pilus assembly ATPase PilB-like protein